MDFYESITHALYCRMEEQGESLTAPLERLEAYHEQEAALEAALSQVKDTANAERALQAARRLCVKKYGDFCAGDCDCLTAWAAAVSLAANC